MDNMIEGISGPGFDTEIGTRGEPEKELAIEIIAQPVFVLESLNIPAGIHQSHVEIETEPLGCDIELGCDIDLILDHRYGQTDAELSRYQGGKGREESQERN